MALNIPLHRCVAIVRLCSRFSYTIIEEVMEDGVTEEGMFAECIAYRYTHR
jgi:hypothetical protein